MVRAPALRVGDSGSNFSSLKLASVNILRRNCPLHDVIEGRMTEVRGVARRRTQLLDDLRDRRYWELKEEAEDRKKMETTVHQLNISFFHKSLDLLISSILTN